MKKIIKAPPPEKSDVLPLGGLVLLMGLNSSLSSPTTEQVCKNGVDGWLGGNVDVAPGSRLLVTDHDLTGFFTLRSTQAWRKFVSFVYGFT